MRVNKIVTEVRNDKNLSFTEFKVTGYASRKVATIII